MTVCEKAFKLYRIIRNAQIQMMDAKRQLETQVALQQKTKELLTAAELELNTLRQQGSSEPRHSLLSPSTPIFRGRCQHTLTYQQMYVPYDICAAQ